MKRRLTLKLVMFALLTLNMRELNFDLALQLSENMTSAATDSGGWAHSTASE